MDSAITLVLFGLLTAFVGDAAASCTQTPNDDMVEYSCEGGHPADLASIPENTEKLRITRMPLRRITTDTFSRFDGNLLVLSCSHCEISDIDANAFRQLVNLQQLSLDNGHLNTVKGTWFDGLSQLTYLDLTYNDIRDIEDDVYKNLPHLVDLRISGNKLQCLNLEGVSHLKTLKRIFLSENPDFACPHAVSKFLENQGVSFEPDPEWRRLASDTIDVPIPPSLTEEDRRTTPAYPDRRPPERPEVPRVPATGDRRYYPDHGGHQRSRHRKPTTARPTTPKYQDRTSVPRVEPIDMRAQTPPPHQMVPYPYSPHTTHETVAATSYPRHPDVPPEPSSHQMVSYPQSPHTTHETVPSTSYPRYPEVPPEPSSHQMIPYPYATTETPRAPFAELRPSEDIRMGTDRPSEISPVISYPSYGTHGTVFPSSYPTTVRPRLLLPVEEESSKEDETTAEDETPENVITYPLHTLTPVSRNGEQRTFDDGYVQITRLPYNVVTSTEASIEVEHAEISSRIQDRGRHEQSPRPTDGNEWWSTNVPHETPHHVAQDSRKIIIDETSTNGYSNSAERVKPDQSQATATASSVHYVRPSQPELMHSPATTGDVFYQAPYYETTATMHPPLQNYPDASSIYIYPTQETTTDKPLPECNKNSAPGTQPAAVLVMSIIITIFGHVIVEGF
ncbi:platelet glycoprotein Ib alpha chain [Linepithema humile]|uniref:platelet glycoprotein Ib alpha chain n=1 Tax=Linepithema humile TaxID=83485 RepID=UPI00062397AF|nr:PREDICTED: mediator of DNA damage checkpoint protein 1-like [Linepithema humile]